MKKLQRIMIPVDFSPVAINAVQYASGILEKHSADVVLVYVNTPENPLIEQEISGLFRQFEKEALVGVSFRYSFEIVKGNLLNELIKAKALFKVGMVIMGSKGKRNADLSLAAAFIRSVYCPVVVVPEHFKSRKIAQIAFANDYKPIRESQAFKPLWEFALEFQAKVYLLHVNFNRKEELVPIDDSESTLEYYLQSLDHEYVFLSSDDMELAITDFIRENEIDLLAILSRDHGGNQEISEGRLISQLAAHSQVPILVLC